MRAGLVKVMASVVLLLAFSSSLWAGSSRSISVSCVVKPRISVELQPEQQATNSSSSVRLLQNKEYRTQDLPIPYESAIVYSYFER